MTTIESRGQKITPFLWFDNQAEEAMKFYTSIFKNSKIISTTPYTEAGPGEPGTVMIVTFELEGQRFMALNGGSEFKFSPAISFMVNCDTQQEIDELWEKLTEGGAEVECGWLTDKYGLSWQIVPTMVGEVMESGDPERTNRFMKALMQMKKLDIATLKQAYDG
jgi:predicted 3-demethylubiquinone-9 3-methyltransferase (glyoxalase superfamily)